VEENVVENIANSIMHACKSVSFVENVLISAMWMLSDWRIRMAIKEWGKPKQMYCVL
jgi:hypothetical protein